MRWLPALVCLVSAGQELPRDQFVQANGVRLHFLDWGGKGEALLFLTSLGGSAGDFHSLATSFTSKFHVLGLTRRGQGSSDKPESGYDNATLVEDIQSFLNEKRIRSVTLVGYSMAGNELTEFAGLYPRQVAGLVYLDAAYDLARNKELGRLAGLELKLPGIDHAMSQLIARSDEYRPNYSQVTAPALGFFVTYDQAPKPSSFWDDATNAILAAFWVYHGKAYRREQLERFRNEVKHSRVVELHNTTHAGFVSDPVQQKILVREMRLFFESR